MFMVHVLLKPGLENFEHYFASVWDECNCAVVWTFLALPFFGIVMKTDLFQSRGHCWVLKFCCYIECSTLSESPFRIWNGSTGIPSPSQLCLWWCFLRPTWVHIQGCLALGEWSHHHGYLGHDDLFCIVSLYSCHLFLISSAFVRSISFLSFIVPIFAWNILLVSLIFLTRSLVFPIPLFSSISCTDHWGRLSYLSLPFFGTLHSNGYISPFLLCL